MRSLGSCLVCVVHLRAEARRPSALPLSASTMSSLRFSSLSTPATFRVGGGASQATVPLVSQHWPARPRRSAAERRAQALRAQGRMVQKLLASFEALSSHRGCLPSRLGSALAAALRAPPPVEAQLVTPPCPSAASSQPAVASSAAPMQSTAPMAFSPSRAPEVNDAVLVNSGPHSGRRGIIIGLCHPDDHAARVRLGNDDVYVFGFARLHRVRSSPRLEGQV